MREPSPSRRAKAVYDHILVGGSCYAPEHLTQRGSGASRIVATPIPCKEKDGPKILMRYEAPGEAPLPCGPAFAQRPPARILASKPPRLVSGAPAAGEPDPMRGGVVRSFGVAFPWRRGGLESQPSWTSSRARRAAASWRESGPRTQCLNARYGLSSIDSATVSGFMRALCPVTRTSSCGGSEPLSLSTAVSGTNTRSALRPRFRAATPHSGRTSCWAMSGVSPCSGENYAGKAGGSSFCGNAS
jgi:hypothetical protein